MLNKKKNSTASVSLLDIGIILGASFLVALVDLWFRVPFDVQGETGLFTLSLIIIATGLVHKRGIPTVIGVLAGILAAIIDPGQWGWHYTIMIFAALGIGIDLGWLVADSMRNITSILVMATLGHVLQFALKWAYGAWAGVPAGIVPNRLAQSALEHIFFGVLAGVLAYLVLFFVESLADHTQRQHDN